jgi:CheY-like chemotaxis protein
MTRSVLIIDNDESIVDLLSFYFSDQGYTVWTARDGDEGVRLALEHRPRAIVCDVIMEHMHGFEVLQNLRVRPELASVPIIIASAKVFKADIARARELGATEYVTKPFQAEELFALVERHVAASEAP